ALVGLAAGIGIDLPTVAGILFLTAGRPALELALGVLLAELLRQLVGQLGVTGHALAVPVLDPAVGSRLRLPGPGIGAVVDDVATTFGRLVLLAGSGAVRFASFLVGHDGAVPGRGPTESPCPTAAGQ